MRFNIGAKIISGYTVMLTLIVVLGIVAMFNANIMNRQFEYVVVHDAQVIANAQELRKLVVDLETGQRGFVITQKEQFLKPYIMGNVKFNKLIAIEMELVSDNPGQVIALKKIKALVNKWKELAAIPEIAMARRISQASVDAAYLQEVLSKGTGKRLMDEIRLMLDEIIESFKIDGNIQGEYICEMIAKAMVDQETGERGFLITGKEEFLEPYVSGQKKLKKGLGKLRDLVANAYDIANMKSKIDKIERLTKDWTKNAADLEIAARRTMNKHPETLKDVADLLIAETGKSLLDQIRREFEQFIEAEEALTARRYARATAAASTTKNTTIIFMISSVVFGVLLAMLITRSISRPVRTLIDALKTFAKGELMAKVKIKSEDEIGDLFLSFNQMVEELKNSNMSLQESEKKFRTISTSANDAIIMIDSNGCVSLWNKAAENMFGFSPEETIGKEVYEKIIPARFHEDHIKGFNAFRESGQGPLTGKTVELVALRKDGTEFIADHSFSSVKISGKWNSVCMIRDITERKQNEEQIKASLKEKEILLSEIHHRVKNNMQVISSILNLQSKFTKDNKLAEALDDCQNRIQSMALVHEKLYKVHDFTNIDFKDYISELTRRLMLGFEGSAGNVTLKIVAENIKLNTDTIIPIGLIVNELITNSMKYAFREKKGNEIEVSLQSTEIQGMFELIVSDNGIGLPEEIDIKSAKTLGLRLVSILGEEQLNGSIELGSNKGAQFRMKFKG